MKFLITTDLAKSCLAQISGGLGTTSIGAKSIYIVVENGVVTFMTNNFRVGYQFSTTDVQIEQEGTILVDGSTLITFVNASSNEIIEFESREQAASMIIKDGHRRVRLSKVIDTAFPVPTIAEDKIATLSLGMLKFYLKALLPISATNGMTTDGIYLDGESIVATDGEKACVVLFDNELTEPMILSRDAAKEVTRIGVDDDVDLYKHDSFLSLIIESGTEILKMSITLVDVSYPKVKAALIDGFESKYEFGVPLREFYNEINYTSLVSDNRSQLASLVFGNEEISIIANAEMESSTVKTQLPNSVVGEELGDEEASYVTKVTSLLNVLKAIKDFADTFAFADEEVVVSYKDSFSPIMLEVEGIVGFVSAIRVQ